MKFHRISALLIRHLYLYQRSFPRIMDIVYWPVMEILVWGFLSLYIEKLHIGGFNAVKRRSPSVRIFRTPPTISINGQASNPLPSGPARSKLTSTRFAITASTHLHSLHESSYRRGPT